MKHIIAFACCLALSGSISGQNKPTRSGEILKQSVALAEKEDYKKALELLKTVHESDTSYLEVQAELAEIAYAAKEYEETIKAANRVITENPKYAPKIYASLSKGLEGKGDTLKSLEVLSDALKMYPYYFPYHYLAGLTEYNRKNFDGAEDQFQKALLLNPYHSYSHIFLGLIASRRGNYSHAIMSLSAALLIKTDANDVLVYLDNLANDALEPAERIGATPKPPKNDMAEIDQLLKSKIALDSKFKIPVKINAPVTRQLKLFVDQFSYKPASDDFWMKFYGPFFQKVKDQNMYKPFIYTVLASTDIKEAKAWNAKGSKEKMAFLQAGNEAFRQNRKTQPLAVNGKPQIASAWYYDSNFLAGLGTVVDNTLDKKTGPWIFYGKNGNLEAKGIYGADFKRTGEWKFYTEDGYLDTRELYENGQLNGVSYGYYKDGSVSSKASYKNNKNEGLSEYFFRCGSVSRKNNYINGAKDGEELVYNAAGTIIQRGTYKNGKAEGLFKYFFEDGTLKTEVTFKEDKEDGLLKKYNESGKLTLIGAYKNGNPTGTWKYYHDNGRLHYDISFDEAGKTQGNSKTYSQAGKLITESKYVSGEMTEEVNFDETDGKRWNDYKFGKGKTLSFKFYDKAGKVISEYTAKKGNQLIKGFWPDGTLKYTGSYTDGQAEGDWIYYNSSGTKASSVTYKKSIYDGPARVYYAGGQLKREYTNVGGNMEGYYKEYYPTGKLKNEGWMEAGNQELLWKKYYPNGQVEDETFYLNGESTGWENSYTAGGQLFNRFRNNFTQIEEMIYYKNDGSVLDHIKPTGKNHVAIFKYANGKPKTEFPVGCNKYNGKVQWYYLDGTKSSEISMVNGVRNGKAVTYHENGKVLSEGMNRNGNAIGLWKYFNENGGLEREGKHNNGRDSVWVMYWPNGKINKIIEYREGEMHGRYVMNDSEGNLMLERHYKNDQIVSYSYMLPSGKLSEPVFIKDGKLKVTAFYQNGKKSAELNYENGSFHGPQKFYFSNGNPLDHDEYIYGFQNGVERIYYPNGNLKTEATYVYDNLEGVKKYFNEDGSLQKTETWVADNLNGPATYYKGGKIAKNVTFWNNTQYE